MNPPDRCFLLNAVPVDIATSYLQRTFGWKSATTALSTRMIYVRYYKQAVPDICRSLAKTFPEACRIVQAKVTETALLISADALALSRILAYLSATDNQTLLQELETLLVRKTPARFKVRDQVWLETSPRIMGILNITPDSFYDGGRYFKAGGYSAVAQYMIEAGADMIDIGGESSRPGATPVDEAEEINRVLTAIKEIRKRFHIPLSIDTVKPVVADAALEGGADMVNDISGLGSGQEMIDVILKHNASYCLMHIQGSPQNMQENPQYEDIIGDIHQFFSYQLNKCVEAGLEKKRIMLDPGIGFGKTVLNNIDILRMLPAFSDLGCLILLGTSNKSFIGHILDREIDKRVAGTMATQALGWMQGASVFRVHEVGETRDTLEMARIHTRELRPA